MGTRAGGRASAQGARVRHPFQAPPGAPGRGEPPRRGRRETPRTPTGRARHRRGEGPTDAGDGGAREPAAAPCASDPALSPRGSAPRLGFRARRRGPDDGGAARGPSAPRGPASPRRGGGPDDDDDHNDDDDGCRWARAAPGAACHSLCSAWLTDLILLVLLYTEPQCVRVCRAGGAGRRSVTAARGAACRASRLAAPRAPPPGARGRGGGKEGPGAKGGRGGGGRFRGRAGPPHPAGAGVISRRTTPTAASSTVGPALFPAPSPRPARCRASREGRAEPELINPNSKAAPPPRPAPAPTRPAP